MTVHRQHVIEEQMIKEGVVINPALDFSSPEMSLTQHLVSLALKKRKELAEAYKRLGVNVNPLLLIQLPNDGSESMSTEDTSIKDEVTLYLAFQTSYRARLGLSACCCAAYLPQN